jgi:hypothetical protein
MQDKIDAHKRSTAAPGVTGQQATTAKKKEDELPPMTKA